MAALKSKMAATINVEPLKEDFTSYKEKKITSKMVLSDDIHHKRVKVFLKLANIM